MTIIEPIFQVIICLIALLYINTLEFMLAHLTHSSLETIRARSTFSKNSLIIWEKNPQLVKISIFVVAALLNIGAVIEFANILNLTSYYVSSVFLGILAILPYVLLTRLLPEFLSKNFSNSFLVPFLFFFSFFYYLTLPVTLVIQKLARILSKYSKNDSSKMTEEDLEFLIDAGEKQGILDEEKHEMLSSVFDLSDTVIREIMVPKIDCATIPADTTYEQAAKIFFETGFSRIPLVSDEKIIGILLAKDLLQKILEPQKKLSLVELMRKPYFVPDSVTIDQFIEDIRKAKQHLAIVLDEYGETVGLVTLEDALEEIVGEVHDEFDEVEENITQLSTTEYLIRGKTRVHEFCEYFEVTPASLKITDDEENIDTMAGLIFHRQKRIPMPGDTLNFGNQFELEVLEVNRRRTEKIKVKTKSN